MRIEGSADKETFSKEVTKVVGDLGEVQMADRRVTLEIRDLDCLAQEEEVQEALTVLLETPAQSIKVSVLGPNKRDMKLAVVVTGQEEAERLALCLAR